MCVKGADEFGIMSDTPSIFHELEDEKLLGTCFCHISTKMDSVCQQNVQHHLWYAGQMCFLFRKP